VGTFANDVAYAIALAGYDGGQAIDSTQSAILSRVERQLSEVTYLVFRFNEIIGKRVDVGWMEVFSFRRDKPSKRARRR
jgi:hypothetical protein